MLSFITDLRLNSVATKLPLNVKIKQWLLQNTYNGLTLYKPESLTVTKVSFLVESLFCDL